MKTPKTKAKKRPARKAGAKKKAKPRKPSRGREPRPYSQPKSAAELGITCASLVNGEKCGKAVLWFDYAIGERNHMEGSVCDEHRSRNRAEKLAVIENQTAGSTL